MGVDRGRVNRMIRIVNPMLSVHFTRSRLPPLLGTVRVSGSNTGLITRITRRINSSIMEYVTVGSASNLIHNTGTLSANNPVSIPMNRRYLKQMFGLLNSPMSGLPTPRTGRH